MFHNVQCIIQWIIIVVLSMVCVQKQYIIGIRETLILLFGTTRDTLLHVYMANSTLIY